MCKYSIVVPVYNSEKSIEELYARIVNVFDCSIRKDFELIMVDDFSQDASYELMTGLNQKDKRVIAIQLSKNCGQHPALLCGFKYATGDFIITMDDDLQHPPEEIPKLINAIENDENADVVIGRYENKKHSMIRNLGSRLSGYISYKFYSKPQGIELTSFRIMRRNVVDDILSMNIDVPRVGNMIIMVNNRIKNVTVEHDPRKYGKSGYTFSRLVRDLFNNLITNSNFPLILVRNLGILSLLLSVILSIYYVARYYIRGTSIVGWTSLLVITVFYGGFMLFAIGTIGDYLMKILNESKKIPKYFVRKIIGGKSDDKE